MLSPASARATRPSTARSRRRLSWLTRGRAVAVLAVSLVILIGGLVATAAAAPQPMAAATAATSTSPAPPPLPLPTVGTCSPGLPLPVCQLPTSTDAAPPSGSPTTSTATAPCTGVGCIPQPSTSVPAPPSGTGTGQGGGDGSSGSADCGITDIGGCVANAINFFFSGVVNDALNPLLSLLSQTLLTTPTPDSLPQIGVLWNSSWQILLISYAVLVLIAGILVMGYETVQSRHSIKEIAPRIVLGFLAGALSLWVATQGITIANALSQALVGTGVDPSTAADTLKTMILNSTSDGGIFIAFIGLAVAGVLVALLITYIVRVALTIILIVGAPLALMFHALPQTEGIAVWWWKSYGACLAIQVGQSLTLITAIKVFLAPGGFTIFGPTTSGLVNLLVALALLYILFKIPFWFLGAVRGGKGRSLAGSLLKGFIAYKTFGLLGGRGGGGARKPRPPKNEPDPYAHTRTTSSGQYILPLPGLKRGTLPKPPHQRYPARGTTNTVGPRRTPAGVQLTLPLGDDWPENKPVLGHDGQYRLPLNVERVTPTPPTPSPSQSGPSGGRRRGQQLQFEFDPYRSNRRGMQIANPGRMQDRADVVRVDAAARHHREAAVRGPHHLREQRGAFLGVVGLAGTEHSRHPSCGELLDRGQRRPADVDGSVKGDLAASGRRTQLGQYGIVRVAVFGQCTDDHPGRACRHPVRDVGDHRLDLGGRIAEIPGPWADQHVHLGLPAVGEDRSQQAGPWGETAERAGRTQLDALHAKRIRGDRRADAVHAQFEVHQGHSSSGVRSGAGMSSSKGNIGRTIRWWPRRSRSWSTPPGVRASSQSFAIAYSSGSR